MHRCIKFGWVISCFVCTTIFLLVRLEREKGEKKDSIIIYHTATSLVEFGIYYGRPLSACDVRSNLLSVIIDDSNRTRQR